MDLDCPNLNGADVYGSLFMVHSWLPTINGQVMIDLDHQESTIQILMVWLLMTPYRQSNFDNPQLTANY